MMVSPRLGFKIALVAGLCVCAGAAFALDDAPLNPMKTLDRAALKNFLEKPLFDSTRRLPPVEPPPAVFVPPPVVATVVPPPTLHLLGVINGLRDIAIVHRDNDEKTIILHTGDHVDDWVVTIVPPVGIRLRNGDRVADYAIFGKPGAGVGAVAAALMPDFPSTASLGTVTARDARLRRRTY